MKKNDLNELKKADLIKLNQKLKELQKEKIDSQVELKMGKIKDAHTVSKKRRNIAQIKTLISFKTIINSYKKTEVKEETQNAN